MFQAHILRNGYLKKIKSTNPSHIFANLDENLNIYFMWPYIIKNKFLYSITKYLFLMTLIIKKERRKNQSKQQQKTNRNIQTQYI